MPALSGKKKEIELQGKNHTHVIKFSKSKGRVVLVSNKNDQTTYTIQYTTTFRKALLVKHQIRIF